jgi:hypothetical protein
VSDSKKTVLLRPDGRSQEISIETGKTHKITVLWPVTLIRFSGPMFALEKCFVLPAALQGIRDLRRIYAQTVGGEVLVVGHTDVSGSDDYNTALSCARARSLAAFLTDDVDTWVAFFDDPPGGGNKWGMPEVVAMLGTLPASGDPYFTPSTGAADAIEAFEADHGMEPSGKMSEDLLRALIHDYMQHDGTTLPPETEVVFHGCGETFPLGGDPGLDRRTEALIFHREIRPEPASETSTAEYEQWREAVTEEHHLGVDTDTQEYLELRLHDEDRQPMARTPFRVTVGNQASITGISGHDGLVFVKLPDFCPEFIRVQWGEHPVFDYAHELDVIPECSPGESLQQDTARLHNLGYAPHIDLEAAVRQFQVDYAVDHDPIVGLVDGALPPDTRARLDEIWDERDIDASTQPTGQS